MSTFGKCFGGGRRAAHRTTAPLLAIFTTLSKSHSAQVVDVSSSGVRLRGDELPKMGEDLVMSIEDVRAFGTVAWSDHGECGVELDPPLSADDEQALKTLVTTTRSLPPDVQGAFDSWV